MSFLCRKGPCIGSSASIWNEFDWEGAFIGKVELVLADTAAGFVKRCGGIRLPLGGWSKASETDKGKGCRNWHKNFCTPITRWKPTNPLQHQPVAQLQAFSATSTALATSTTLAALAILITQNSPAFAPQQKQDCFDTGIRLSNYTNSTMAISAASPRRGPVLVIRT